MRIFVKQGLEATDESGAWVYCLQEVEHDGKNVAHLLSVCWRCYEWQIRASWHHSINAESSVPETAMMRTDIANIYDGVQP